MDVRMQPWLKTHSHMVTRRQGLQRKGEWTNSRGVRESNFNKHLKEKQELQERKVTPSGGGSGRCKGSGEEPIENVLEQPSSMTDSPRGQVGATKEADQ